MVFCVLGLFQPCSPNKPPRHWLCVSAGLLLCYELPVQTDRSGKPIDRFLVTRSRSFQQTLTALIHEVQTHRFLRTSLLLGLARTDTTLLVLSAGEHPAVRMAPCSAAAPGLEGVHGPGVQCSSSGRSFASFGLLCLGLVLKSSSLYIKRDTVVQKT